MLSINCTKKLLLSLGIADGASAAEHEQSTALGTWYANLFDVDFDPYLSDEYPHRYLLLINDESLLSFYVRVPNELSFEIFLEGLPQYFEKCFLDYKFSDKQIKYLLGSYTEVHVTAANNSCMNGHLCAHAAKYARQIRGIYHDKQMGEKNWHLDLNQTSRSNLVKPSPARAARHIVAMAMRKHLA